MTFSVFFLAALAGALTLVNAQIIKARVTKLFSDGGGSCNDGTSFVESEFRRQVSINIKTGSNANLASCSQCNKCDKDDDDDCTTTWANGGLCDAITSDPSASTISISIDAFEQDSVYNDCTYRSGDDCHVTQ
jgi:hypothetical protein